MRILLAVCAMALCACSPSIKGQFLSSEQYVNVYEEKGQLLADMYRSGFHESQKPEATFSLTKDGDIYRGDGGGLLGAAGMTMSVTKTELMLVFGGEKSTLKRINSGDAREKLDTGEVVSAAHSALLKTTSFENKYSPCGELDLRKRAAVKEALDGAKLEDVTAARQKTGLAWDRYEVRAALKLPEVKLTLSDQDVCTKHGGDMFFKRCVSWAKQDFTVSTAAVTLPLVARVDQSRFPEADPRDGEMAFVKLGDTELPDYSGGRELEELLCKRVLSDPKQMAFSEQQASDARPSQTDPTARNDAK